MAKLKQEHFDKLVECCRSILAVPHHDRKSPWIGKSTRAWLTSVQKGQKTAIIDANPNDFCAEALDRGQLSEKISQSGKNASDKVLRDLAIDIFAWGGMKAHSARSALSTWDDWKAPCRALLQGCDAIEAYDHFYRLHNAKRIKGIGPAYYTKLIHFLGKGDGLIMDQWTSRSINLLFDKEMIALNSGKYVRKTNDSVIYQTYNEAVSMIARKLTEKLSEPVDPSQAEEYLFSFTTDRRKKGELNDDEYKIHTAWRKYVKENHRP